MHPEQHTIVYTADGSATLFHKARNEHFHSIHGAVQESMHVFIEHGWIYLIESTGADLLTEPIRILEVGFGTGLNALLTLKEVLLNEAAPLSVGYTGVEPSPLPLPLVEKLDYAPFLGVGYLQQAFLEMHKAEHLHRISFGPNFHFTKVVLPFQEYSPGLPYTGLYDLVYFDAFSPAAEPDLWTVEVFAKLSGLMKTGGVLTTYCSKGEVRRGLQSAGFKVERLPGPPGKHQMLRAVK